MWWPVPLNTSFPPGSQSDQLMGSPVLFGSSSGPDRHEIDPKLDFFPSPLREREFFFIYIFVYFFYPPLGANQ